MKETFLKVAEFKSRMEQLGSDFACYTSLPAVTASVSFLGCLQGQAVLWNMTLATLAHYREASAVAATHTRQDNYRCPFIDIKDGVDGVYQIRVGLDLEMIDEPSIKKTIIMIRNYKRLAIGKIEFCAG